MSCWLPACHAPRIAEGFAHVPQKQLRAGNWGRRQTKGAGGTVGKAKSSFIRVSIVLRQRVGLQWRGGDSNELFSWLHC